MDYLWFTARKLINKQYSHFKGATVMYVTLLPHTIDPNQVQDKGPHNQEIKCSISAFISNFWSAHRLAINAMSIMPQIQCLDWRYTT